MVSAKQLLLRDGAAHAPRANRSATTTVLAATAAAVLAAVAAMVLKSVEELKQLVPRAQLHGGLALVVEHSGRLQVVVGVGPQQQLGDEGTVGAACPVERRVTVSVLRARVGVGVQQQLHHQAVPAARGLLLSQDGMDSGAMCHRCSATHPKGPSFSRPPARPSPPPPPLPPLRRSLPSSLLSRPVLALLSVF